ncbi:hypothetical protein [Kitasatospora kazusensis]|uniref:hypothetical protein n=1 Tax=Kitasatospora kazusensis TaxID=407974 RepID=UPI0031D98193
MAGRPINVRWRLEDESGDLVAADVGTAVTAVVVDGSGAQLVTGQALQDGANAGVYLFSVPPQSRLDLLSVTFAGTLGGQTVTGTEQVQLVDRRVVPLSVLRQDQALSALPLLDFLRIVDAAEDAITNALRFSPVLMGERAEWRSRECVRLFVPGIYYLHQIYALTRNDQDQLTGLPGSDPAQGVHVRDEAIERGYGYNFGTGYYDPILGVYAVPWLPGVYKGWVCHGWTETPADLAKAVLLLARHLAQTGATAYPDRATRIMTEQSEIWFSTPNGADRPFGLPEVDGVIVRYRVPEPLADDRGAF